MLEEFATFVKSGLTFGSAGVWTLCIFTFGLWWKGLPAFLDAWTRRSDKEADRIDKEFDRLGKQITASDERHAECEKRCEKMQDRLDEAMALIDGLRRQAQQQQLSAVRVGAGPITVTETLIAELDRLPSQEGKVVELKPRV